MFKTKAAASAKLMIIPLSLLWKSIKLMRIYYLCAQAHPPRTFCATFLYRMTIIDAEPPGPHIHTIYIYIYKLFWCVVTTTVHCIYLFFHVYHLEEGILDVVESLSLSWVPRKTKQSFCYISMLFLGDLCERLQRER